MKCNIINSGKLRAINWPGAPQKLKMSFRNWGQLYPTPVYLFWKLWTVNVPTGSQMCSSFSLKHLRGVTEEGRLWRTPEWEKQLCPFSSSGSDYGESGLELSFLLLKWQSSQLGSSYAELKRRGLCALAHSQELSLVTWIYTESWRMCYSAFSGLNVYFRRFITGIWLSLALKLCICLNSIILVSTHHWFLNTETLN